MPAPKVEFLTAADAVLGSYDVHEVSRVPYLKNLEPFKSADSGVQGAKGDGTYPARTLTFTVNLRATDPANLSHGEDLKALLDAVVAAKKLRRGLYTLPIREGVGIRDWYPTASLMRAVVVVIPTSTTMVWTHTGTAALAIGLL